MNKTRNKSKSNAQIGFKIDHSNTVTERTNNTKFTNFKVAIEKERNGKLKQASQIWSQGTSTQGTSREENCVSSLVPLLST